MKIGAIVTIARDSRVEAGATEVHDLSLAKALGRSPIACNEFLGQTLLKLTIQRLREAGVQQHAVLFEDSPSESFIPSRMPRAGKFFSAWENVVAQELNEGADVLFLIRLGAYLEIDFADLLRFHRETSGVLTQVYGKKSAFEVAVVDAEQLRAGNGSYRGRLSSLIPYHGRYSFQGYSNRLREPGDFRLLALDALMGRNSIRPAGKEIGTNIWTAENSKIDPGARLSGPVYIGANTQIQASCNIGGASTIERDCEVDFGTSVTDCSVLPGTYLGMGLSFVHSIIAPNRIFHLERNISIDISDPRLIGSSTGTSFLGGFTKSIRRKVSFSRSNANFRVPEAHLY